MVDATLPQKMYSIKLGCAKLEAMKQHKCRISHSRIKLDLHGFEKCVRLDRVHHDHHGLRPTHKSKLNYALWSNRRYVVNTRPRCLNIYTVYTHKYLFAIDLHFACCCVVCMV